jgi:hypothetical protein
MMSEKGEERVKKRKSIILHRFPPTDKVPRTKNGAGVQMMMGSTSNTSKRKSFSTGSRWSFSQPDRG